MKKPSARKDSPRTLRAAIEVVVRCDAWTRRHGSRAAKKWNAPDPRPVRRRTNRRRSRGLHNHSHAATGAERMHDFAIDLPKHVSRRLTWKYELTSDMQRSTRRTSRVPGLDGPGPCRGPSTATLPLCLFRTIIAYPEPDTSSLNGGAPV